MVRYFPLDHDGNGAVGCAPMNDPIEPLLERMRGMRVRTHQEHDAVIREAMSRIEIGRHLAGLLDDALFYARIYKDQDSTGEGKRRREEMINDSMYYIQMFRREADKL